MALPVILVNSATGSDTAASGAGPATALTGSGGVSAADGLTVDLSADAPNLSGVATDGSAVLFFNDTNTSSRNFAKITAANNSTKVVTVANAVRASQTKAWAIGGKRSAIGTTLSRKLIANGASVIGDALGGWAIEMESGHAETLTDQYFMWMDGSLSGGFELRGTAGAATLPILTFSNDGLGIIPASPGYVAVRLKNFELRNSNVSKTASYAIVGSGGSGAGAVIEGIKIDHATNYFYRGIYDVGFQQFTVIGCNVARCLSHGVWFKQFSSAIAFSAVHHNGGDGVRHEDVGISGFNLIGNLIYANGGHGAHQVSGTDADDYFLAPIIALNTIHGNTGDGLRIGGDGSRDLGLLRIISNIFTGNGGYGVNLFDATAGEAGALGATLLNNCFGVSGTANTSGKYNPSGLLYSTNEQNVDPQFTDASTGDFTIGTNLKALGYPTRALNF